ncbi:type I-E CRISPR-associated protein Cse1/CasA [Lentzea sp. NBC_00516]|uniref:type I-E CRISPR-associated protein Cse1/CasA n=1 Tax=Lentzea sp. NBC_00516 TaxID=2903582 RepID=UPI002E81B508|nr:type I-E CRISPR-associated protein Cse1/CasA [Lentzea sp. NBC_00516]WUD26305.1 type I-E CRISPR-associated protein Cse1/CasA [Lentzea sp. NBC_00516]
MTSTRPASYDLRTQPWLPVVDRDGNHELVSLTRLVLNAHRIRRIVGETPSMTAALHRLVLALLHRVYGPPSEEEWARLCELPSLPSAPLVRYLRGQGSRFDLFDAQHPFLQCTGLAKLAPATAAKLVPYRSVGNNVTLFDKTIDTDQVQLTPAEAARWLVTVQSFDPGGMKTPFEKDKSSQRAPCAWLGVVLVEGETLKETLLLNLLTYRPEHERPAPSTPEDGPIWEQEAPPSPLPDKRVPRGWTDLLTWPARRVLLSTQQTGEGLVVDGVTITPGSRLNTESVQVEMMAAFRKPSGPKGQPKRDAPMLPVRLHPVRGVWRHSVELLMTNLWEEGKTRQRPRTLEQISELAEHGHIPAGAVYTLRVFDQKLDSKGTVVEAWLEEVVPAPVAVLRSKDKTLGALLGCAIVYADSVGAALRHMQRNYRVEKQGNRENKRVTPTWSLDVEYWPKLARPFATYLEGIARAYEEGESLADVTEVWQKAVAVVALRATDRWAEGSPAEGRDLLLRGKHQGQFLGRLSELTRLFHAEAAAYIVTKGAA